MLRPYPIQRSPTSDIVVGLDDSAAATNALRWASVQSRETGAPLHVVHVWQARAIGLAADGFRIGDYRVAAQADARARATRWALDALRESEPSFPWWLDIEEGSPGPVLVQCSAGAGLLVLGTRQHSALRRAALGSVSHHCLAHADLPVVAVPSQSLSPVTVDVAEVRTPTR